MFAFAATGSVYPIYTTRGASAPFYRASNPARCHDNPWYPRVCVTQVIFILLLAASLAFFARPVWLFGRAVAAGVPDPRPRTDDLAGRLMDVGIYFFGQKKVAEEGPLHQTSKHHLFIFWGFLIITIATADIVVSGVVHGLSLRLLPDLVY